MSLQRAVDQVNSKLNTGLGLLATVGSTAPFVGLFGTVWGILNALVGIGIAGQASIDKVAGPVGEALIMTAIGLFVAVPAVMGYNWLLGRNKAIQDALRNFASDLHAYLVSGAAWVGGETGWCAPGRGSGCRDPQVTRIRCRRGSGGTPASGAPDGVRLRFEQWQ